jgi:ribosomal-protein-alanine N-acetyltransferase
MLIPEGLVLYAPVPSARKGDMKKETVYTLFSRIPTLETDRLILRGMKVSDAADMFDYARRPQVTEYLLWTSHGDIAHTREYLTYIGQRYRTGDFFDWAVVYRENGRMIGTCGFTSFDYQADAAEIGYVLNPDFGGQGLATEAVRRVLDFGFGQMALHRIEARFMQGNDRSLRLMERVGMTFEGWARESMKVKGAYRTIGTCAILRDEYEAQAEALPQSRQQ